MMCGARGVLNETLHHVSIRFSSVHFVSFSNDKNKIRRFVPISHFISIVIVKMPKWARLQYFNSMNGGV